MHVLILLARTGRRISEMVRTVRQPSAPQKAHVPCISTTLRAR